MLSRCPRMRSRPASGCQDAERDSQEGRMKSLPIWIALAVFVVAAADAPKVTYVDHDKVGTALNKGGPLVSQSDLLVSGSHREKGGQVEIHEKETDVIYVVEGEATFVTGGTVVGQKQTKAGQFVGT